MNLDDIRIKINEIDEKMRTLFDARMECTKEIAKVKIETGDSIYKPEREKEMYAKYEDNPNYVAFLKKVVQLSRRKQYEFFIDYKDTDEFRNFFTDDIKDGKLILELKADEKSENGLCIKDILAVVSASTLNVECVEASIEKDTVIVGFNVPEDEVSQKEAYILKYMLEKETL